MAPYKRNFHQGTERTLVVTTVRLCFAQTFTKRQVMRVVVEPSVATEFEVQAVVWLGLRRLGVNARGEVKTRYEGRRCVRFDVAIFEGGVLTHIIEIRRARSTTKQVGKTLDRENDTTILAFLSLSFTVWMRQKNLLKIFQRSRYE